MGRQKPASPEVLVTPARGKFRPPYRDARMQWDQVRMSSVAADTDVSSSDEDGAWPSHGRFTRPRFNSTFRPACDDAGALHAVVATANHALVEIPAGWWSISLALGGVLQASSGGNGWEVRSGALLVWDEELAITAARRGSCIVLCGAPQAWRAAGVDQARLEQLLPEERHAPRDLVRLLVRVARCARARPELGRAPVVQAMQVLWEGQEHLRAMMERCTGRTRRNRRRVMLRLLRLRHVIRANPGRTFDMDAMCAMTSFSPWHLARVFREVFRESPVQYATRLRLEYARELVEGSGLPFGNVAVAAGFDCQSSFNRAFRRFYNVTPGGARAASRHPRKRARPVPC